MKTLQRFKPSIPESLLILLVFSTLTACSSEESLPGFDALASEVDSTQEVAPDETTEPTPDTRQDPAPMPKPEPEPEPKPEPAPEPKPEPKPRPQPAPEPTPEQAPEPQPEPAPKPKPEPAPEPQPEPAPKPEPEPVPEANTPAMISGVDVASVTEDSDWDSDGLLEVSGKLEISDVDAGESAFRAGEYNGRLGSLNVAMDGNWRYAASNDQVAIQALAAGKRQSDVIQVRSVDGTRHGITITINGTDDAALITGDSNGSLTEDVDPDRDNLLEVGGKLTITDPDSAEAVFVSTTKTGSYGNLTIDRTGNWSYAAANSQTSIQALAGGAALKDTILVSSVDGTTTNVIITINGADDATVIGGVDTGSVTEDNDPDRDNLLEAAGKLTIKDPDSGEAGFVSRTRPGLYGNLSIDRNGNWAYAASNDQASIQALAGGAAMKDTIQVSSVGGTTHQVVITINGADDATVISGKSTGSVTEDVDPDRDGLLEVGGRLTISDRDAGEAAFMAGTDKGSYGNLTIDRAGNWNYAADNSKATVQSLTAGGKITDRLQVSSVSGTRHDIVITINGADDATVFGGVDSGSVTEDIDPDGDGLLEFGGKLTINDPDAGDAVFVDASSPGTYGHFSVDAAGNWSYAVDNNLAAIQNLDTGAALVDRLTVSSINGATHDVSVTIAGVDEAPTSADVTLSWVAPVEREDGTPISMAELAGYRVYYGTSAGNYTTQVDINNGSTMNVTLSGLTTGTYYIVVTAIDVDGRESVYSQEAVQTI